ncbi:MAG: hypothetical protein KJ658_11750, partial [Proteobacteria bacterium]|nr:hypothetical protein [Pseudomonadota bacterium]
IGIIEDPGLYGRYPVIYENSTLAGIHFDRHFVVSGFRENLMKIAAHLRATGTLFQKLPISHGFHSPNIDPAFTRCQQTNAPGRTQPPQIDIISCLTGKKQIAVDKDCFWAIARQPILFPQALKTLCREIPGDYNMIDLGPAGTYAGFTRQNKVLGKNSRIYRVMTHFKNELRNLAKIKHALKSDPPSNTRIL